MNPVRVIICGAKGRMGQALIAGAKADPEVKLVGEIDAGDKLAGDCDVIVDFSAREATAGIARFAAQHAKAIVIGTTGHSDAERKAVLKAAKPVACVWTSNFSTGVNLLFWLTGKAAGIVPDWNVEIVETHHTAKKDAPSGTAKTLQQVIGRDVPTHSLGSATWSAIMLSRLERPVNAWS